MRRMIVALLAATAGLTVFASVADAFSGRRGTRVNQVDAKVFEVIARSAGSSGDYWCGAGDFAQRALGAPWTARIYILRGRGASATTGRRTAVQFTMDAAAAGAPPADNGFFTNTMRPGDSMSVQQAQTYCLQPPMRF